MSTFQSYNPSATRQTVPGVHTHPEYDFGIEEWEMIRDVVGGSRYVKARGTRYLPMLHGQAQDDYSNYRTRALFFNATRRTRDAMVGLLLRKTPSVAMSAEVESIMADVDLRGSTMSDYINRVAEDTVSCGRCGTLIDWNEEEARPYFSFYRAEDIVDWEEKRVNGRWRLTTLTLREQTWEKGERSEGIDATRTHSIVQTYLEYRLKDGIVEVRTKISTDNGALEETMIEVRHKGRALTSIPFVFHGVMGNRAEILPAPLADIAEINISHYRTSADLENGRHMAGLPTLYAAGFDAGTKLVVGSSHAWVTENTDAHAGYIEFTGQGLTPLKEALSEKQEQMAALGARMLEIKTADAEAFETVQLRSNAEQASLTNVSSALSATISRALQFAAWWYGTPDKAPTDYAETDSLVLSTDFVSNKISSQQLTAMTAALQSGAISLDTYFYNLEQGEMFPDSWTIEDEKRAIEETPPSMKPPTPARALPAPAPTA